MVSLQYFIYILGWRDESLAAFRRAFCEPSSTYNTLCAAPEVKNVTSWCLNNFNATSCGYIREQAQEKVDRFMIAYYYGSAVWGILLTLLVSFCDLFCSHDMTRFTYVPFATFQASACRSHSREYHFETSRAEIQRIKRTCLVFTAYSGLSQQRAAFYLFDLI